MPVYLWGGSAQTVAHAATLRWKLQIKLSTSPSHSILTPGWPVPVLTLYCQALGRVATGVLIFKLLLWFDPEKSRFKGDLNPRTSALKADALTTRPTRRTEWERVRGVKRGRGGEGGGGGWRGEKGFCCWSEEALRLTNLQCLISFLIMTPWNVDGLGSVCLWIDCHIAIMGSAVCLCDACYSRKRADDYDAIFQLWW